MAYKFSKLHKLSAFNVVNLFFLKFCFLISTYKFKTNLYHLALDFVDHNRKNLLFVNKLKKLHPTWFPSTKIDLPSSLNCQHIRILHLQIIYPDWLFSIVPTCTGPFPSSPEKYFCEQYNSLMCLAKILDFLIHSHFQKSKISEVH